MIKKIILKTIDNFANLAIIIINIAFVQFIFKCCFSNYRLTPVDWLLITMIAILLNIGQDILNIKEILEKDDE